MHSRKLFATVAVVAGVVVAMAAPALAHVTIQPAGAPKGSFSKLTFQVPNELDNANTISVDVKFPDDHPIASVSVQPKTGWTAQVTKKPLPIR